MYYIKQFIKRVYRLLISIRLYFCEFGHAVILDFFSKQKWIEAQILLTIHSLEKGMGVRETKVGYGKVKAQNVIAYLRDYLERGYSKESYVFGEAINMLDSYVSYNLENGVDFKDIKNELDEIKTAVNNSNEQKQYKCGVHFVDKKDLLSAKEFDFEKFVALRHSMRDFIPDIVDKELIKKAVSIANEAPSACNRQASKVYCTATMEHARMVDALITGTGGFKGFVHNFMVITCDRALFMGEEQFQWYVNGGIFISYLILALHSLGLGSCIMQWFPFYKKENELKRVMNISATEAIVAVIGFGYYKENNKCICAQRKTVEDVLTFMQDV